MKKISIITISFNQGEYLERCIISVLNQNYKNLEHIIVDNESNDNTNIIINKYKNHFSKIIVEKDNGPADALNKGFNFATGEILYFLNSDDELTENSLSKANYIFSRYNPDYIFGSGYIINDKNKIIKKIYPTNFSLKEYVYNAAVIFQQGVFFKKSIYEISPKFNVKNRVSWDGELFFEFKKISSNVYISYEKFGRFRIYPESGTGSGKLENLNLIQRKIIFEKEMNRLPKNLDKILEFFYRYLKFIKHLKRTFYILMKK
jgi:glycosyltransferase involved in cell wall biosynthesis